jgi:alpha-N-arabinofuranosidase
VPTYDVKLAFIGSGPSGGDLNWTRGFFQKLTELDKGALRDLYGWALHYYCGTSGKGQAVDFTVPEWYDLLSKADVMESLITRHWDAMGEVDNERRVKLIVDEWGAWHNPGTEVDPAFLFGQMPTMRDALISGITLDTFNRHAGKVAMANAAQLVNNLHALFLAHEDRFTVTTNYHVFQMYAAHQGGKSLRAEFSAPRADKLWGLAGSASVQGNQLVLTAVNPHVSEPRAAEIVVRGAAVQSGEQTTLSAPDIHAHNTFDEPGAVEPKTVAGLPAAGKVLTCSFPPASVTRLRLTLA